MSAKATVESTRVPAIKMAVATICRDIFRILKSFPIFLLFLKNKSGTLPDFCRLLYIKILKCQPHRFCTLCGYFYSPSALKVPHKVKVNCLKGKKATLGTCESLLEFLTPGDQRSPGVIFLYLHKFRRCNTHHILMSNYQCFLWDKPGHFKVHRLNTNQT